MPALHWPLAALLLAGPAAAAPAGDAAFAAQARAGLESLKPGSFTRSLAQVRLARRLDELLRWCDAREKLPAIDAAAVAAGVVDRLARGEARSLFLGETHGVAAEQAAAQLIVGEVLARGPRVGAFLREDNLYPDTSALAAHGVPVRTYRNQFAPQADIDAAVKAAKDALLISYTGVAHSARGPKDYFLYTLLEGLPFGFGPGRKDMPTVEGALIARGLRPMGVAMLAEEHPLERIQQMLLGELVGRGRDLSSLRADLDDLLSLWGPRLSSWPVRTAIAFVRDPDQPDLYIGVTPGERRPLELAAAAKALALPECAVFLGGSPVTSVESLQGSSRGADGRLIERHWDVIVHAGARQFQRTIPDDAVQAEAGARPTP